MVEYRRSSGPAFWELKVCRGEWHATVAHSHGEWSLGWIESGACDVGLATRRVRVEAPALVWFSPETVHECRPLQAEDWAFRMVYWRATGPANEVGIRALSPPESLRWKGFFDALARGEAPVAPTELSDRGFACSEARVWEALEPMPRRSWLPGVRPDRPYKRLHGLAPTRHRTVLKVRLGQELLRRGVSPSQAASEAGFYDQSQFTRAFRALTGTTPARFLLSAPWMIENE